MFFEMGNRLQPLVLLSKHYLTHFDHAHIKKKEEDPWGSALPVASREVTKLQCQCPYLSYLMEHLPGPRVKKN